MWTTAAGLKSLLNSCPEYLETDCSQMDFQPLKAPEGGFEMGYDYVETGHPLASNDPSVEDDVPVKEHSEINADQVFDKLPPPSDAMLISWYHDCFLHCPFLTKMRGNQLMEVMTCQWKLMMKFQEQWRPGA